MTSENTLTRRDALKRLALAALGGSAVLLTSCVHYRRHERREDRREEVKEEAR
jgi:hypothetical protein